MKTLIATDGSPSAEHAINEMLRFVHIQDIDAYVIGVARTHPVMVAAEMTGGSVPTSQERERLARDISIARAQAQLRTQGIEATPIVCEGDPAHEILACAKQLRPDLIVMGTHGRGAIGRLVMGSVSQTILHTWDGAVLVVRAPQIASAVIEEEAYKGALPSPLDGC